MGLRYSESLKLSFDFCDVKADVKLPLLLAHCLTVSARQSAKIGRGNEVLLQQYGLIWVVTDYDVTIDRMPRFGETVTIETQAISYNKLFCYRQFHIYDQAGQLIITVLSHFALLNPQTRKVAAIPDDLVAPYQADFVKKIKRPIKIDELQDPMVQAYQVRYFDIDMNGHANNSKYLDWMYDVLGHEFLLHHRPCHLTLTYIKEVKPSTQITSGYHLEHLTSYHEIRSLGQLNAQAVIKWQPMTTKESETN
ncbi:TPA: acyl-[acyl-carrier-protein] thioesterase [Streptococcus equi subsp. zooepidemicus]|uniref:acyl-ACP thioesterase domain-containing protein n=1 Tax=Streptococcus equi TaxID=1336 RepID=UPI0013F5F0B2|nr:acyl-ACP thioesterase domain-containing protein [Streptococcus equi]MCD3388486.1 acyl-[acyl-carrier-protein] thioesterase [Streptococcus equi subsp. zooepidemicus]MCD3460764.1 acyl-[acyl-carrier-protein] thioesterase [Streptococcus equi subsp. zooepidemicus]HEK9106658.1 acyl-[acyl-carrier-protein] thioesterase [Streptococcus equi subsp. zooepidemicus]HEK9979706.1 acyl-[acyl-carrier-protein] thioesterase [Streptococcus equi subsp. zooepidemicus]HEL0632156.1 acyl-[acyl-carrier-protein] thioes